MHYLRIASILKVKSIKFMTKSGVQHVTTKHCLPGAMPTHVIYEFRFHLVQTFHETVTAGHVFHIPDGLLVELHGAIRQVEVVDNLTRDYLVSRGELGEMSRRRIEPLDNNNSFILSMKI